MQDSFSLLDTASTGTTTFLYYLKTTQYKYRLTVSRDFLNVLHRNQNYIKVANLITYFR